MRVAALVDRSGPVHAEGVWAAAARARVAVVRAVAARARAVAAAVAVAWAAFLRPRS